DAHMKLMIELFDVYDQQCQREGVVDFSELLLRSYEVLFNNEPLRTHYQNRFSHILVDEFQDTNKLQYKWLKLLTGPNTSLFAVGDDDQSIYAFRGANVGNMNDLMREFKIEAPIKLEQNYRSVGNILAAANAVIEHNDDRLGKNLHTEAGDGELIRLHFANNDFEEAQLLCDEAKSLEREGWTLSNMAILYRSNAQSRVIEQILFRAGVPYKIYGGLRFFERQEIKHALAYLRLVANEHDDNALLRVINVPARGIGTRSVEALQALAQTHGVSLWQAACMQAQSKPAAKISAFVLLVDALKQVAQSSILPELMREVIHQSGLYGFYENNPKESQDRLDNLNELISAATTFDPNDVMFEVPQAESAEPVSPLLAFLSNAALESGEHQAIEGVEALQMMTIHAAKGLEFDAVFLTGLEEGLFPSEYSLAEQGGLAEERRLMYVAITRARKRLYLSAAQQRMLHGKTHFGLLSRFIDEIPAALVHKTSATYDHADVAYTNPYQKPRTQTAALSKPLQQTQTYAGFEIGQNVRHAKFGTGVIIDAEANGDSAKLHINFGREGVKWLDTQYANLAAV
nr:UvrD-helicase domain-containing protein [Neisseriaceae bacterium]